MKELSIFVDESGDFGPYDSNSPYYLISLVLHEQNIDISSDIDNFESSMRALGWPDHCVHSGPVIRAEYEYKNLMLEERQHLIRRMMTFTRHLDIRYQTIILDKKNISGPVDMTGKLSKQLARFIKDHLEYLLTFDRIKVYYDNGQVEITRILSSVFNALLDNVEFKKGDPL